MMPEPEKLYDTTILIQTHHADQAFVKHMISLFLEHIPHTNVDLEKACAESDWQKVYFYAHKMKASIDLFSLIKLKDLIRKIEQNAKNHVEIDSIPNDVKFVSAYIKNCIAQMKIDFDL
ncbi:MAG TPA: Hpt domain-containing protein [Parafilimonas sp.]|jgi:HPt (histidine-containing phosphotransfer) domain-containing protein